nr:hypothetical protein [uncultured Desulfobulbus sp.]
MIPVVLESGSEDTTIVFSSANGNAISMSGDSGQTYTFTLSVSDGNLILSQTTGLSFTSGSQGSASMTVSGSLADINAALEGLQYVADTDFHGSDTIDLSVVDEGWQSLSTSVDLAGYYTFDNTATLGTDESPTGTNDGTVIGATSYDDSERGTVLDFTLGDTVLISGLVGEPSDVTVAAWVNFSSTDLGVYGSHIVSIGDHVVLAVDTWARASARKS